MIIKGVNFSNKYTTGSVTSRLKTVEQLCSSIFWDVIKEYKPIKAGNISVETDTLSFLKIEQMIKKRLPEFINFYISKYTIDYGSAEGCVKFNTDCNRIKNYRLELPLENKKLPKERIPVLMHELTHMLDFATNPQHRVVRENMMKRGIIEDAGKFYKENYYTKHHFVKTGLIKNTEEFLKNYTADEKLLILRYIKLNMCSEISAYNATNKYANLLQQISYYMLPMRKYPNFHFKEKVDLVNGMRYKLIKKERRKNAKAARFKWLHQIFKK